MRAFLRFVFPRSLNRLQYTFRLLIWTAAVGVLFYVRGLTDTAANASMLIIWCYLAFFVIWPRARESGMPFIWAVLALVPLIFPFLSIMLMFRPPTYEFQNAGGRSAQA